jgi:hypothetical protein
VLRGRLPNIEGGEGSGKEDEPRQVAFCRTMPVSAACAF